MPNSLIAHAIGHLTRDWKAGETKTGTQYASNGIAVNTDKENTTFISLVVWGKQSGTISEYSGKGSAIYVTGSLSEHEYDGKKSLQMNVRDFQFLGSKSKTRQDEVPY